MSHRWCPLTDFCMDCGTALQAAIQRSSRWRDEACPGGDSVTYQKARHHMEVVVAPVLERLGFAKPETRH